METTHETLLSMVDLERLTGVTYKPIQKRLANLEPVKTEGKKILYCSKKALPLVLRVEREQRSLRSFSGKGKTRKSTNRKNSAGNQETDGPVNRQK